MTSETADRAQAARALGRLLREQRTLDQLEPDPPFKPLVRELLYGTTRHFFSLANEIAPFLKRPLRSKDQDVYALLLIGAYQIRHLRIPDHAAVTETVAATRQLGKPWARGLVNACLRNLLRRPTDYSDSNPQNGNRAGSGSELLPFTEDEARFDLPLWLLESLADSFGDAARALAEACGQRAPMTLRIKPGHEDQVRSALEQQQSNYHPTFRQETWVLDQPVPQSNLEVFQTGACSAQDAGAQLGFSALEQLRAELSVTDRFRWLDACCAPGGKLFHALEQWHQFELETLAVDLSERRLQQVRDEALRLGFGNDKSLELRVADASQPDWYQGPTFDLALIDAPCSGSGTLRRHPDIKLLRDAAAIDVQARTQQQLLESIAGTVRPGGGLLYATCSLLSAENDAVVGRFLEHHPQWSAVPLQLPTGQPQQFGWQLLPTDPRTDGFYYAALKQLQ